MKNLEFSPVGVCTIRLAGVPDHAQIEELIEAYVVKVEVLPFKLRTILIDISNMVHMGARSRKVFSELVVQASRHYGGKVDLVIAGGSCNVVQYIKLFCKGIGFRQRSHFFDSLGEAEEFISRRVDHQIGEAR